MSQYQKLEDFFMSIDGPLLNEQRTVLCRLLQDSHIPYALSDSEIESLKGLQNLLDALADICHDDFGIDCLLTEEDDNDG